MVQEPIHRFSALRMSSFKTLVFLFSLGFSLISKPVYAQATGPALANRQCGYFYRSHLKKPLVKVPEIVPVAGIWDRPKHYDPSPMNQSYNNKETRNLDQSYSRECFLFSYLGALESSLANRHLNPRPIQFSSAYLVAKKFEHVIREIVTNDPNQINMYFKLDGGEAYHAMKLTELYGLVPEDIWKPLIPIEQWDFQNIYTEIIDRTNAIVRAKNENPLFYRDSDSAQITQAIFQTVMGKYVGQWPKPFWYDGVSYTPESFGRRYSFDQKGEVEILYTNPNGPYQDWVQTSNLPTFIDPLLVRPNTQDRKFNANHKAKSTRDIFKSVKEALAKDSIVLLDVDGYDSIVGHEFAITDVEVLPSGKVKAVKLKNSYTNWGSGGYAWYSPDAITKVLRRIWIIDVNKDIPLPKPNPN